MASLILTGVGGLVGIRLVHCLCDRDKTFFLSSLLKVLFYAVGARLFDILGTLSTLNKESVFYDVVVVFESSVELMIKHYGDVQQCVENSHDHQQRTQCNVVVLVLLVPRQSWPRVFEVRKSRCHIYCTRCLEEIHYVDRAG